MRKAADSFTAAGTALFTATTSMLLTARSSLLFFPISAFPGVLNYLGLID
jgi:hypothetical protein